MLRARPFTPTERVVAWLLAAGVAAFAAAGLALGLRHHRWPLVVASVVVLSVAALYMAAEDDAFWYGKHREKDHVVSVEQQLAWLKRAGFVHTACHWRYWNWAIISAHKA